MTGTREALEISIAGLTALMSLPDATEQQFQTWFESNPVVFEVLGYSRSIPHPELPIDGAGPMYPDFVAQRPDGLWDVIELKRPDTRVIRNRERRSAFYSDMGTYIAQCQEYSERASQVPVAQHLRRTHGIEMNALPHCVLVAGRAAGLDRLKVHDLLKRSTIRISHQTYDDVLDALQRHYVGNYLGEISGPGLSVYAQILLAEMDGDETQCLVDLGESPIRNRITVSRVGGSRLKLAVIDNAGLTSSKEIELTHHCNGAGFICGVHVTHAMDAALVLLEVNGEYAAEHRVAYGSMALAESIPLVVGVNMHGEQGASMVLGFLLFRNPALNTLERAQLRERLFEKYSHLLQEVPDIRPPLGVRYSGTEFMCTEGHPILDAHHDRSTALVQRNVDRRPTFAG